MPNPIIHHIASETLFMGIPAEQSYLPKKFVLRESLPKAATDSSKEIVHTVRDGAITTTLRMVRINILVMGPGKDRKDSENSVLQ
jgi:hypothetical protein